MAARSKARTETVGSNPTGGMDVCVHSVFVLSCVQVVVLQRANPLSKEFYWKRGKGPPPQKGCRG
jgi:hypothetical protein